MLTEDQVSRVHSIFRRVHGIFEYVTDKEKFGTDEYWMEPALIESALASRLLRGDCDDFALACRHLLDEAGIPNRLVVCAIEDGSGHLVCEAEGYILDNRQRSVVTADQLPYTWVKMSGYKHGDPWTAIA